MLKHTIVLVAMVLFAASTQAAVVQLDMSGVFNFDAVGTANEVSTNVPGNGNFLIDSLGDHQVNGNKRAYTNDGSAGAVGRALPDNGQVGAYQISTAFDNGTDYLTKSNNALEIETTNLSASETFTLNLAQQGTYASFNVLMVVHRDADFANYRSYITANYTDSSSVIVVDTGLSGEQGVTGAFGYNNYDVTADATTFTNQAPGTGETIGVSNVISTAYALSQTGSIQSIRTGTASLWEFDQDITLDSTKTLESLTFTVAGGASGQNRNQELYILAVNADLVPEPATMGLLSLGGLALLRRRKK